MNAMDNGLELTWLGHATWLMKSPGGKRLLFDPWLENPKCPEAYRSGDLGPIDGILVTHGHGDHIGSLLELARSTGAPVLSIFDLTSWLEAEGIDNTIGLNKGGECELAGIRVALTEAVHSSSFMVDGRPVDLGDPCGMVLTLENGFTVYNAGDTTVFGDMALIAELYSPDLAMLPIGDHFTMGPRLAAKAVELLGVDLIVPQHYGTFPALHGRPEELQALLPEGKRVLAIEPGETLR